MIASSKARTLHCIAHCLDDIVAITMEEHDQATQSVLQALQTLYHDPQGIAKKGANEWLEEFQHSVSGHDLATYGATRLGITS